MELVMEIKEAMLKKKEVEDAILALVIDFQGKTGLTVGDIQLRSSRVCTIGEGTGDEVIASCNVTVIL
jgi:hypothetical protein